MGSCSCMALLYLILTEEKTLKFIIRWNYCKSCKNAYEVGDVVFENGKLFRGGTADVLVTKYYDATWAVL